MDLMKLLATLTLDKDEYDKGLKEAEKDAKDLKIDPPKIPKPDDEEFKKGLEESKGVGATFKEVMTGVWNGIKDAIVVTGITSAVMGVVGAMRQGINMAIENGDSISKGAANLKLSTKAYQEYSYVLGKSNLQMKDLSTAMTNIDKVKAGKGTKDQAEYLEKLNLNAEDAAFGIEQLMSSIADYKGDDKGAIIDAFFGKGDKWTGFFEQTSSDIKRMKEEAADMGLIMPDEAVQNAVEFKDATEELNNRLDSIKRSFGESFLPMLTSAAKMLAKIVAFFSGSKNESLAEMLAGDDKELAGQLATIEGTGVAAESLADKLLKMGDTSQMTADQYAIWKGTAEELIRLVPTLSSVINTETGEISANSTQIKENIKQWKELAKQKAVQSMKEKMFQRITEENEDLIQKQVDLNVKESRAQEKKQAAIDSLNKYLKDNPEIQKMSGFTEVTEANFAQAKTEFDNYRYQGSDAAKAVKDYESAVDEIEKLRKEAEETEKELSQVMQDYNDRVAALDALYGTASDDAASATAEVKALGDAVFGLPNEKNIDINVNTHQNFTGAQMAIGGTIPYDNYPALLHRGEKVLTATQVRRGEGMGGGADLSHLEDRIAAAIRAGMDGVSVNSYINGRSVTDEVNRNNMRDVKGRRFAR